MHEGIKWRAWLHDAWPRYVSPSLEREDPRFRRTLARLSVIGLRVIGGFCLSAASLWLVLGAILVPEALAAHGLLALGGVALIGLVTMGASFAPSIGPWARLVGLVVLALLPALDLFGSLGVSVTWDERWAFVLAIMILMMLVAMGALPIRPLQMAAFGGAFILLYGGTVLTLGASVTDGSAATIALVFLVVSVLTCTGLTTVVYYQRMAAYRARRSAQQAFEELRDAQVRVNVSENAASQSRFAAALSHELNTPLGALASAFDTVIQAHERELAHPESRAKLEAVWAEASRSGRASATRLRETIGRMKRLTNLDRSEIQVTDVNELWKDTVALLSATFERKAKVKLALGPVPPVRCHPQQIGAVFSNLLRNAAAAMVGPEPGHIGVSTEKRGDAIVMVVEDDGCGMPEQQVKELFQPTFHVDGDRVATTNWGLFVCRSILAEHGGGIEIESEQGVGTKVRLVLPLSPRTELSALRYSELDVPPENRAASDARSTFSPRR